MHLIDPTSGVPVFRQVADQLREEIASGSLRPGALLPSERMLMDRYGVARGTARFARRCRREELTARMPSPEEASSLRLSPGIPVVALIRTAFDTEGVAVEVFDSALPADKYAFTYEFPAT